MQKKQVQQKNIKKSPIVDQQNEPFLRTIFKRVRNINKKLTQISELKGKVDLKPQQIQKVNRKAQYQQERKKLENIADFFRQVYAENQEHYKNNQLQQIDALAQAIAVLKSKNVQFKQINQLNDLNRVISQDSNQSFGQNVTEITQVLRRFATDYKLKKLLTSFIEGNSNVQNVQVKKQEKTTQYIPQISNCPPILPPKEQKVQVQVETTKVEVQQTVVETKVEQTRTAVEQSVNVTKNKELSQNKEEQKPAEEKRKYRNDRPKGQYRPRNNNRTRNQNRQQGQTQQGQPKRRYNNNRSHHQHRQNEQRRQRPNYRPKQQNVNNQQQHDSDSSFQQRQAQIRNFKRDEKKKLQQDGFIIIGGGKPQTQKKWHDKKPHYNNGNRNSQRQQQKQTTQN